MGIGEIAIGLALRRPEFQRPAPRPRLFGKGDKAFRLEGIKVLADGHSGNPHGLCQTFGALRPLPLELRQNAPWGGLQLGIV
jgi:hypothetical protein